MGLLRRPAGRGRQTWRLSTPGRESVFSALRGWRGWPNTGRLIRLLWPSEGTAAAALSIARTVEGLKCDAGTGGKAKLFSMSLMFVLSFVGTSRVTAGCIPGSNMSYSLHKNFAFNDKSFARNKHTSDLKPIFGVASIRPTRK